MTADTEQAQPLPGNARTFWDGPWSDGCPVRGRLSALARAEEGEPPEAALHLPSARSWIETGLI